MKVAGLDILRPPGWGIEPVEEAVRAHPPKVPGGLLHYRQP